MTKEKLEELRIELFKNLPNNFYTKIKTFEEMCAFQKSRGYKFGWTIHKCVANHIEIPKKYKYMAKKYYNIAI